jgi:hypothetical protein
MYRQRVYDLTDVFFVNRRTIPWPPEPLRLGTLGMTAGLLARDAMVTMNCQKDHDEQL